jgi:uncharacterized membrane-anchored protein YitT (DUF2179 family)
MVRIITNQDASALIQALSEKQHGITIVDGHGAKGPVKLLFTVVKRKNMREVLDLIDEKCPDAFYSVEDVRSSSHGVFVNEDKLGFVRALFPIRKGK